MRNKFWLISLFLIGTVSLATPKIDPLGNASFEAIKLLPMGTSGDQIKKMYGPPDVIDDGSGSESWLYYSETEGHGQKLTFGVDKKTNTLTDKVWMSYDDDSLRDLKFVESKFSGSKFVEYPILWCYGDSAPDDTRFVASEIGVTIIFRKTRHEVSDVFWNQPGIKYPKTCTKEELKKRKEIRAYWAAKLKKSVASAADK